MALASKWSIENRPARARTKLALALGVSLLTPLLSVSPAQALPDDACIKDERCKEHYTKAIQKYKEEYFEEALTEFQAAYEARKMPLLLINIGRTMQKLGRPKEAITYYERFLAAESKPDPEVQKRVTDYMTQAKALMGPENSQPDPNAQKPLLPPPPPPPPPGRNLIIAGGVIAGVGVIGLLTGVGLYAASSGEYDKFKNSVDEFDKLDAKAKAQSLGTGSTAAYAVGAAALLGGGALIAVGAKKYSENKKANQSAPTGTPAASPQAVLVPSASGLTAVVMGEF